LLGVARADDVTTNKTKGINFEATTSGECVNARLAVLALKTTIRDQPAGTVEKSASSMSATPAATGVRDKPKTLVSSCATRP
jgi:hypothetical protein